MCWCKQKLRLHAHPQTNLLPKENEAPLQIQGKVTWQTDALWKRHESFILIIYSSVQKSETHNTFSDAH